MSSIFDDLKDMGKILLGSIADQYNLPSSHDYELYDSGKKCYLTYVDSGYGKKIYKDQSGQLWCTRNDGRTFYKYDE